MICFAALSATSPTISQSTIALTNNYRGFGRRLGIPPTDAPFGQARRSFGKASASTNLRQSTFRHSSPISQSTIALTKTIGSLVGGSGISLTDASFGKAYRSRAATMHRLCIVNYYKHLYLTLSYVCVQQLEFQQLVQPSIIIGNRPRQHMANTIFITWVQDRPICDVHTICNS